MRKIQKGIFFSAAFAAFIFSSCSSSEDSANNSNSPTGKLPVTNNANVTPLTTPTPSQSPSPKLSPTISPTPSVSPTPTPKTNSDSLNVKIGKSTGVITKLYFEHGIIELDHEDIPGMMPAMVMEFYVKEKTMLKGLKVGDKVGFVLEERDGVEKITEIKKQ